MLETLTAARLGALLEEQVRADLPPVQLADWAHRLYLSTRSDELLVSEALIALVAMGEGPEFWLERADLLALARRLLTSGGGS